MTEKIDFVVTWVDGSDPKWQKQKQHYMSEEDKGLNSVARYRDWEIFKYWFRAVEKHAPWVNKVVLITEGHVPEWLNINHEKLLLIKHSDYIPQEYLPTFNSNVIELNIHRIEELSEHFVLFNDDMFINKSVGPEDFFRNGLPTDVGVFSPQVPKSGGIASISLNNIEVINDYFNTHQILKEWNNKFFRLSYGKHLLKNFIVLPWNSVLGFYDHHLPVAYKKSTFKHLWNLEEQKLRQTSRNKFRTKSDINHWLMRYWQLASGQFTPRSVHFGNYYSIFDELNKIISELRNPKYHLICLNDGEEISDFEEVKQKIAKSFAIRYLKSLFEI
ncbi:Stealth CR1 domain-containing protein [Streptococcus ruminantium]|uniref:Capsule biosynthesis protein n=1 Tax=Streptococcus ruminantium TaxID=1917441 RepID=A0A2Z5U4Q7_9STRE|nr:Stealth CR1 domain-containing protein [Streptococcus ruminantium]BBA92998.1 capsule biosynthesis protein [Streptococcus ruminantium]